MKWSSFSFNMLIKGFKIQFIKVANIKFLLPCNRSFFYHVMNFERLLYIFKNDAYLLCVLTIPMNCSKETLEFYLPVMLTVGIEFITTEKKCKMKYKF